MPDTKIVLKYAAASLNEIKEHCFDINAKQQLASFLNYIAPNDEWL